MPRALNFGAGPATLPLPALERARDELLDFAGSGASVMEHSHRTPIYGAVQDEAVSLLRQLASIPDTHEVLFLTGGASQQFAQLPFNFLGAGRNASYILTGAWGEKALEEGQRAAAFAGGEVRAGADSGLGDGDERTWVDVPSQLGSYEGAAYVHATSNETVHGVQFRDDFPDVGAPLVVDMSSDFLWRPTDFSRIAFAYAGAQKNIGPSGVVVAVAERKFLESGRTDLPKIFSYATQAKEKSLYNTPPTFGIYLVRNVLAWTKAEGGLGVIHERNLAKSALVYDAIDASGGFYRCPVNKRARSTMNVVFRLPTAELEAAFLSEAAGHAMIGLKGHRSVGGIRASLYNAVPLAWARILTDFMGDFARRRG